MTTFLIVVKGDLTSQPPPFGHTLYCVLAFRANGVLCVSHSPSAVEKRHSSYRQYTSLRISALVCASCFGRGTRVPQITPWCSLAGGTSLVLKRDLTTTVFWSHVALRLGGVSSQLLVCLCRVFKRYTTTFLIVVKGDLTSQSPSFGHTHLYRALVFRASGMYCMYRIFKLKLSPF